MVERLREMERGRRERIEKGCHCFFKSSGYDKLELKHQKFVFYKLIECIIKKNVMVFLINSSKIKTSIYYILFTNGTYLPRTRSASGVK